MNIAAEVRRHRVDIQKPVRTQDPTTGGTSTVWQSLYTDVPCAIKPVSVRDFIQSRALQSDVTVRIIFRYLDGITPDCRLVGKSGSHKGKVFNPSGFLEDPDSGRRYITAPCSEGVNEGDL